MSEQSKKLVPNIRFTEFKNAVEWVNRPFGDGVLVEHKVKSDGKCEVYSVSVNKGVVNQVEHLGRSFSAADTSKYSLVRPYDVIYTKSPTGNFPFGIVKQNLNEFNVIVSPLYGVFSPPNKYVGYIINSYFESPIRTNSFLSSIVQKGAKNTIQISNSTFLSKGIPLPVEVDEQRKIADCLSSLDDLITAQNQKIKALKQHKKGLMQQLFPADGETIPKRRFPEFENDGEWEFIPLNKLAKRCTLKNHSGKITRVLTNSAEFGVVDQRDYFDKDIATQGNLEGYFIVEKGDYVYNPRISAMAPVGPISKNNIATGVMSPLYTVFRFESVHNDFYALFFKSTGWHHYMRQASSTGARHDRIAIANEVFMDMPLPVTSPEEQQKIADCLSTLDDLITTQTQKLEALKEHKKGLMQQLFPSLDEM